jgi:hypothetical protein
MKISGPLAIDISLWDDHIHPLEIVAGGVVSIIVGLYKQWDGSKYVLNTNSKRLLDQTIESGLILQTYFYYYPQNNPVTDANWFADMMQGYPVKFAWADCEDAGATMDKAVRSEQYRKFTEQLCLRFPKSGVYCNRYFPPDYAPNMDLWLGKYKIWLPSYGKQPASQTQMTWETLKANWLPDYELVGSIGMKEIVGHQFTGDRCILPAAYTNQNVRRTLDVSTFTQEFIDSLGENIPPIPPVVVEPPIVIVPPAEGSFMNILTVKYVSQLMNGSLEHNNDCGSASSLMLLNTYNLANGVTVDQFYNSIHPSGDTALSAGEMQTKMASYGLKNTWKVGTTIENVYGLLRSKKPPLALIHYAPLVDAGVTEKTTFRGAHFLVITGLDLASVYVNDPYRTDGKTNVAVPVSVFEQAWRECSLDGNPNNGAIIPIQPISDLSVVTPPTPTIAYVVNISLLNVRSTPSSVSSANIIGTISLGTIVNVDSISGTWGHFVPMTGFLSGGWSSLPYLTKV